MPDPESLCGLLRDAAEADVSCRLVHAKALLAAEVASVARVDVVSTTTKSEDC